VTISPDTCFRRFTSGLLQPSTIPLSLTVSSLFKERFVELRTSEASVGTFLNSGCNVCIFILLNKLPRLPQRHLLSDVVGLLLVLTKITISKSYSNIRHFQINVKFFLYLSKILLFLAVKFDDLY